MKRIEIKIRKIIRESITHILKETIEDVEDFYELENDMNREIFSMIKNNKKIKFNLIRKNQYHNALKEFMVYGRFIKFPENIIYEWKQLILENIVKLSVLTSIAGHSTNFPFEEFFDEFDYSYSIKTNQYNLFSGELDNQKIDGEFTKWKKQKFKETGNEDYLNQYDFHSVHEFLDEVYNIDSVLPFFSNGQYLISDFGLEPLVKLAIIIINQKNPNEIIVTINRILDVVHQRSDLAEIFIEGGSKSLSYISNS